MEKPRKSASNLKELIKHAISDLEITPVQGTGADIKKPVCLLYLEIKSTEARIIGCVHDEIIIEAPEAKALETSHI